MEETHYVSLLRMPELYRVAWRTYAGAVGCGEYVLTLRIAEQWVSIMNKRYGTAIYHWPEQLRPKL